MRDIDGVTRVTATDSAKPDNEVSAPTASEGGEAAPLTGDGCQTRTTIPEFNLIAAFDGVTVPPASAEPPVTPPATGDAATETDAPAANDGGVGEVQGEGDQQAGEVAAADKDAENAKNLAPGG